jgi:cytidylate kinase
MSRLSHAWAEANLQARITAHVHAWENARQSGQPLATGTTPFVTISRQFGCEAVPLALRLSEVLNERCQPFFTWVAYDRQLLDKVSQELQLQRGVVEAVDGRRRNEMSEMFDAILNRRVDETLLFRKLAEVVRALAIHGHAILVGRGSYLLTQDLKTGLHVRLEAPRDWRIAQIASKREVDHATAAKLVEDAERQREQFLRTFFVQDPKHPFHHDLVIDNSRFNLDQVVEIIFTALSVRFGETLVGA